MAENDPSPRYEPRDVDTRGVGLVLGGLLATVVLVMAAIGGLVAILGGLPERAPDRAGHAHVAAPQRQVAGAAEREAYLERQRTVLSELAWSDRPAGLARIPIEDAKRLLAERGWPPEAEQ